MKHRIGINEWKSPDEAGHRRYLDFFCFIDVMIISNAIYYVNFDISHPLWNITKSKNFTSRDHDTTGDFGP